MFSGRKWRMGRRRQLRKPLRGCPAGVRKLSATLAVLIPVLLVSAAGFAFGVANLRLGSARPKSITVEVVVVPGDTLWSIAREALSREADLRATVDHIMRVNNLPGSVLRPGQVLLVEVPLDQASASTQALATGKKF